MASGLIRAAFAAALVAVAPLGTPAVADELPLVDRFAVFGDSLSDPGNVFIATHQFTVRPFEGIPSAPYAIGRFHFSNGPTWVEDLAKELHVVGRARPSLLRRGVYANYAFGGARARDTDFPFDLGEQVALFLQDFGGAASDTLYILWIGSSDARDALEHPGQRVAILGAALEATVGAIRTLSGAGAQSFLVLNLPDLADTPALNGLPQEVLDQVRELVSGYNETLELLLGQLVGGLGIDIVLFDVFTGFHDLVADPESAGFTNATDSCITPGVFVGAICRHPREYVFWDFIHPTKTAHAYLAEKVQTGEYNSIVEAPVFAQAS
jgi:phospholipase/lecithinase/hemolysin